MILSDTGRIENFVATDAQGQNLGIICEEFVY
jgi:hypothetical protein